MDYYALEGKNVFCGIFHGKADIRSTSDCYEDYGFIQFHNLAVLVSDRYDEVLPDRRM